MTKQIAYSVTAIVGREFRKAYESFMAELHIPHLLETGHFAGASLECSEPGRYQTRYIARSREALDQYLANDAMRLRAEFTDEFPVGVELSREEWVIIRQY